MAAAGSVSTTAEASAEAGFTSVGDAGELSRHDINRTAKNSIKTIHLFADFGLVVDLGLMRGEYLISF